MALPDFLYASPLYRLLLAGPAPSRLTRLPPPAGSGDPGRGKAIIDGTFVAAGESIRLDAPFALDRNSASPVLEALHGFSWLDDLAAVGGERASDTARLLVAAWIEADTGWHALSWEPSVLGTRIAAWLAHARLVARGDGDPLGPQILKSLARQVRHLGRAACRGQRDDGRLLALRGLIYARACGFGRSDDVGSATRLLQDEIRAQILPDGGHATRSPARHLGVLAVLADCRDMLAAAQHPVPPDLASAIGRMATMLRFYRHGDGGLALFNDSAEGSQEVVDAVLARAGTAGAPPDSAADTGFERLTGGRTLVIMDCGEPPPADVNRDAHAGTLAFEMSCADERLIVNCGAFATTDAAWSFAQRTTAAHSTIVIDGTNSSTIDAAGRFSRRAMVSERTHDIVDGSTWVSACHDGYHANFGMIHRRRLYLAQEGDDLRGEDTLIGPHHGQAVARFHLHPDVSVSLVQNGASALLKLRGGAAWRFQVAGGRLDLAESVYVGGSVRRRSEQIVVGVPLEGQGALVKWALKRL